MTRKKQTEQEIGGGGMVISEIGGEIGRGR